MATLAFTSALSRAGVNFLAASPETMIAPGVSSSVAHAIAANENDPAAMGKAIVTDTMKTTYGNDSLHWSPAAAFDVIDCDPSRVATMEHAVRDLNGALIAASSDCTLQKAILRDANSVDGFTRNFPTTTPWRADRPAIALYGAFAADTTLPQAVRTSAASAVDAVTSLVVAHGESAKFAPFGGADYRDAVGPSVHFPTDTAEYDPWAPKISETNNAFYKAVDGSALAHAIA